MAVTEQRGIQMTLLDYFKDTDCFTLSEATAYVKQVKDVKEPSIRARIYEGIDKGIFRRLGKGVYTVTRKDENQQEATCMLIHGNGKI